ncbi:hypothetical protein EDD38_7691 [Kitasatospora cineracea]|uniref:Acetyltransferase (GNAT) family protein n=1 Tax=Kitasatospora cineracea TaxID=88074 RepID=A0A3N4R1D2_9ACTN|nr:hypothetical protein EDD38_7691 [Kitasatospora cineracea]
MAEDARGAAADGPGAAAAEVRLRLSVRGLTDADLPSCGWAGSPKHVRELAGQVRRAAAGEIDYLAACTPAGLPVALCGVDYAVVPGAGTLWQLGVHPALQSCGIGTLLIGAAERRIAAAAWSAPSWASRSPTRGPAPSTSASATAPSAGRPTPGTWRTRTARSAATRRCAS